MESQLTAEDRRQIEEGLRGKYTKVARSPEGLFQYPTGRAGLEALGYDPEMIQGLPPSALASYCGVGNPFTLGPLSEGEAVLDLGCGGGVDTFVAAIMVGPRGKAVGVDLVGEMLAQAEKSLRQTALRNVTFQRASAEELPFPDQSFEVVISNGVFNLIPDKAKALAEVFRVLKPGGRIMLADQVLVAPAEKDLKARVATWFQ